MADLGLLGNARAGNRLAGGDSSTVCDQFGLSRFGHLDRAAHRLSADQYGAGCCVPSSGFGASVCCGPSDGGGVVHCFGMEAGTVVGSSRPTPVGVSVVVGMLVGGIFPWSSSGPRIFLPKDSRIPPM